MPERDLPQLKTDMICSVWQQFSDTYLLQRSDQYRICQIFDHQVRNFFKDRQFTYAEGSDNTLLYCYRGCALQFNQWPVLAMEALTITYLLQHSKQI
ncbi:hypothetical protein [Nodosilinea sp. P-1105]|uniref:hypothetical protein n=1 Tax=Nodosilinea sp. P-1105 TaxID=2546229 RepID=UPI00146C1309|nr:hypothetical protein [Nodosilinea sp. P-1105]